MFCLLSVACDLRVNPTETSHFQAFLYYHVLRLLSKSTGERLLLQAFVSLGTSVLNKISIIMKEKFVSGKRLRGTWSALNSRHSFSEVPSAGQVIVGSQNHGSLHKYLFKQALVN